MKIRKEQLATLAESGVEQSNEELPLPSIPYVSPSSLSKLG